ncbi:MAG: cupin domain-containing protein [Clostridiales Family XIII bacterium]|jgi:mannose-6-phosphate isomerase-like protein (cupin superfamily)|nr:cupin domain-containing protein [Clostridiales Family XIII bacterium]
MNAVIKRQSEAEISWGGPELCREYFITDRLTLGTSTLEPGETGETDWGHKNSDEIWFVVKGQVRMRTPASEVNDEATYDLQEGDAILIPEAVPHEVTNTGAVTAILSWSLAPSESFADTVFKSS